MPVNPVRTPSRSVQGNRNTKSQVYIVLARFADDIAEQSLKEDGTRTLNLDDFLVRPLSSLRPQPQSVTVTVEELGSDGTTWGAVSHTEIDTELMIQYLNGEIQLTIPDIPSDIENLRLRVEIVQ